MSNTKIYGISKANDSFLIKARSEMNPDRGIFSTLSITVSLFINIFHIYVFSTKHFLLCFQIGTLMEIGFDPFLTIPLIFGFLNYFNIFRADPSHPTQQKVLGKVQKG